ncbi:MobA/MobL family protein [Variovorax terrae]|uniref:MobA/MobL family protein n=1 Tax=Variovorax terrae TaxID=2923278 RepID=A0A9X1VWJ1_9BURK|nr:MobA/MobL family protein [Variovorax terrae]MCJ0764559.1 MobA/MobL family protein [Variovorax terrae]
MTTMASFHHSVKSGKRGAAAEHARYITRQGKHSSHVDELVDTGHGNLPEWASDDPSKFWRAADKYERKNGTAYREHEIALPNELTLEQQQELVQTIVGEFIGRKPFQFAVHSTASALAGEANTHVHLMFSDRLDDGIDRDPKKTFKRFNAKQPHGGGRRKDSGGKNRLELRDNLMALRERCAEMQNGALARSGHAARVDHRSLQAQGIERSPEWHLGPAQIRSMSDAEKERYLSARQPSESASADA